MKPSYIISLLLFPTLTLSTLEVFPEDQWKMRYSLTQCVLSAAKEFQGDTLTISLSIKDYKNYTNSSTVTDRILLKALNDKQNWSIFIFKLDKPHENTYFYKRSDNYIIQTRDPDEFLSIITYLKPFRNWNPHANFIVVTSTIAKDPNTFAALIVETLWRNRVLNAIIMIPQTEYSNAITIHSWFPFSGKNCANSFVRETNIVNECHNGIFLDPAALFPNKVPRNMHNCTVKVRAVIWPPFIIQPKLVTDRNDVNFTKGIEILILKTIANVANFTIVYSLSDKEQDWGYLGRNRSSTGMMRSILDEEVDIGIGALAPMLNRHQYFDTSVPYLFDSTTWCIPHSSPLPKWKSLLIVFQSTTWILLFTSYFFITFAMKLLSLNNQKQTPTYYKSVTSTLLVNFAILLGLTVKTLPKPTKIRLLLILWVLVSLNLNSAYQSSLISVLTQPNYEKQIEEFDELIQKYNIGLVPPTFKFLGNYGRESLDKRSWVLCDNVKRCLDRTAYDKDLIIGLPRMYMVYVSKTYVSKRGEALVYWSKDNIVSYPIEMIMVKGFYLLKRINQLVDKILEAGLISKWTNDFLKFKRKKDFSEEDDLDDGDVILTVKHLEGAFIILLYGLGLASFVFVLEIIW